VMNRGAGRARLCRQTHLGRFDWIGPQYLVKAVRGERDLAVREVHGYPPAVATVAAGMGDHFTLDSVDGERSHGAARVADLDPEVADFTKRQSRRRHEESKRVGCRCRSEPLRDEIKVDRELAGAVVSLAQ